MFCSVINLSKHKSALHEDCKNLERKGKAITGCSPAILSSQSCQLDLLLPLLLLLLLLLLPLLLQLITSANTAIYCCRLIAHHAGLICLLWIITQGGSLVKSVVMASASAKKFKCTILCLRCATMQFNEVQ